MLHGKAFIFTAIAAVSLAAASFLPLLSSASSETTTTASQYINAFESHFDLENVESPESGNSVFFVGYGTNYGNYSDPLLVYIPNANISTDGLTFSGQGYHQYGNKFGSGQSVIEISLTGGNYGTGFVKADGNVYQNMNFEPETRYIPYVVALCLPSTTDTDIVPIERIKSIFSTPNAPGGVVVSQSASSFPSLGSYVRSFSSKVAEGNPYQTTTVTTTTSTTTTTTTASTLPPFPYETAPPFELPSDWTADFQETVPAPDVGNFSVTTPAEVTVPNVPSEVAQGVGFWFTLFSDLIDKFSLAWVVLLTVTVGFIIYMIWGR